MVKITNGVNVIEVTRGAFNSIYSKQGFIEVDKPKLKKAPKKEPKKPEETSDDTFVSKMEETPISEWKKEDIKRYCEIVELDITDMKPSEAKEAIKEYLANKSANADE